MQLREYIPSDCAQLAELFYQTVHSVNAKDYTKEQLDAWQPERLICRRGMRLSGRTGRSLRQKAARLSALGTWMRLVIWTGCMSTKIIRGKALHLRSAICDELERFAAGKTITTHASITAKPFFLHRGYRVVRKQEVIRRGVVLTNFVMEKQPERVK